ncbi:hypothetical protein [Haloprofundus halobius]|nr:hypothetical protein [Haloprofundus halobius]
MDVSYHRTTENRQRTDEQGDERRLEDVLRSRRKWPICGTNTTTLSQKTT